MSYEVTASDVSISPTYNSQLTVTIEADYDDFLRDVPIDEAISFYSEDTLLDEIGGYTVCDYFGLVDRNDQKEMLEYIDIDKAIRFFGVDTILDYIGLADVMDFFGLEENDDDDDDDDDDDY